MQKRTLFYIYHWLIFFLKYKQLTTLNILIFQNIETYTKTHKSLDS